MEQKQEESNKPNLEENGRLREHQTIKLTVHNLLDWSVSIVHSASALGLILGYHSAAQQGQANWLQFQRLRRTLLICGIGCGVVSAMFHTKEWRHTLKVSDFADRFPFMWSPRLVHVVALSFSYLTAKLQEKFRVDYLSSFLQQKIEESKQ